MIAEREGFSSFAIIEISRRLSENVRTISIVFMKSIELLREPGDKNTLEADRRETSFFRITQRTKISPTTFETKKKSHTQKYNDHRVT